MAINRGMGKEDRVHTHNGVLLSHKHNEILPFVVSWILPEIIILSEVSQTEKYAYHVIIFICEIQRMIQMSVFTIPNRHADRKRTYSYQG